MTRNAFSQKADLNTQHFFINKKRREINHTRFNVEKVLTSMTFTTRHNHVHTQLPSNSPGGVLIGDDTMLLYK